MSQTTAQKEKLCFNQGIQKNKRTDQQTHGWKANKAVFEQLLIHRQPHVHTNRSRHTNWAVNRSKTEHDNKTEIVNET